MRYQRSTLVVIGIGTIALLVSALFAVRTDNKEVALMDDSVEYVDSMSAPPEGTSWYVHPRYKFVLAVPDELTVERYPEGNASEVIVFQHPEKTLGFQVFITPYAQTQITKERLARDVRGEVIEAPQEVVIGQEGIPAAIFWSTDPSFGRLREVWFIHDGFIYEVTTFEEHDEWLAGILHSWRFEQ